MLGTFHFFSFSVRVQTLGSRYSRAEPRVLHFDPRAPAGGGSVRLLRKGSVVASLPLQDIQAVAFDEAEPRSLILVAKERLLVDFEDAEDNLVFRLAFASVAVGVFDGAPFASGVLLEGEVAKRGLSGWRSRYALLVPRRLILLSSRTAAYPRAVIPLSRCTPRLDSGVGVLHLEGGERELLLRVGDSRGRALAWLAATNRAAATSPLVNPPPPGSLPASLPGSRRTSHHMALPTFPITSTSTPPSPAPPAPMTPAHIAPIPGLVPVGSRDALLPSPSTTPQQDVLRQRPTSSPPTHTVSPPTRWEAPNTITNSNSNGSSSQLPGGRAASPVSHSRPAGQYEPVRERWQHVPAAVGPSSSSYNGGRVQNTTTRAGGRTACDVGAILGLGSEGGQQPSGWQEEGQAQAHTQQHNTRVQADSSRERPGGDQHDAPRSAAVPSGSGTATRSATATEEGLVELAGARAVLADLQAQLRELVGGGALPPSAEGSTELEGGGWGMEGNRAWAAASGGGARCVEVCACVLPSAARAASWEAWSGGVPAPADPIHVHAHSLGVLQLVLRALQQPAEQPVGAIPGRHREGVAPLVPSPTTSTGFRGSSSSSGAGAQEAQLSGAQLVAHVRAVRARWLALYGEQDPPAAEAASWGGRRGGAQGWQQVGEHADRSAASGRQLQAAAATTSGAAAGVVGLGGAVAQSHFSLASLLGTGGPDGSVTPSVAGGSVTSTSHMVEIKPDISHILPGLSLTLRVRKPGAGSVAPSRRGPSVIYEEGSVRDGMGSVMSGLGGLPSPPPSLPPSHPTSLTSAMGIPPAVPIQGPSARDSRHTLTSHPATAGGHPVVTHTNPLYEEAVRGEGGGTGRHTQYSGTGEMPHGLDGRRGGAGRVPELGPRASASILLAAAQARESVASAVSGALAAFGNSGSSGGEASHPGRDASTSTVLLQPRSTTAGSPDVTAVIGSSGLGERGYEGPAFIGDTQVKPRPSHHSRPSTSHGSQAMAQWLNALNRPAVGESDGYEGGEDALPSRSSAHHPGPFPDMCPSEPTPASCAAAVSRDSQLWHQQYTHQPSYSVNVPPPPMAEVVGWALRSEPPQARDAQAPSPQVHHLTPLTPGSLVEEASDKDSALGYRQYEGTGGSSRSRSPASRRGRNPLPPASPAGLSLGHAQGAHTATAACSGVSSSSGAQALPAGAASQGAHKHDGQEGVAAGVSGGAGGTLVQGVDGRAGPSYTSVARTTLSLQSLLRQLNQGGLSPAGFLRGLSAVGGAQGAAHMD